MQEIQDEVLDEELSYNESDADSGYAVESMVFPTLVLLAEILFAVKFFAFSRIVLLYPIMPIISIIMVMRFNIYAGRYIKLQFLLNAAELLIFFIFFFSPLADMRKVTDVIFEVIVLGSPILNVVLYCIKSVSLKMTVELTLSDPAFNFAVILLPSIITWNMNH